MNGCRRRRGKVNRTVHMYKPARKMDIACWKWGRELGAGVIRVTRVTSDPIASQVTDHQLLPPFPAGITRKSSQEESPSSPSRSPVQTSPLGGVDAARCIQAQQVNPRKEAQFAAFVCSVSCFDLSQTASSVGMPMNA